MSTPAAPDQTPRELAPPARVAAAPTPAQKCPFQNESYWRPLKPDDNDDSKKAADLANQMLKERLGSLLLSQNLLLLFGSGASVAVGGPSMQALWDEAEDSQKAVFAEVCDAVGHPKAKKDIEALLSRCQGALAFAPAKAAIIKAFIEAVEGIIRDRCRKIETWEAVIRRSPTRVPRPAGFFAAQPEIHAHIRRGVAGDGNCAAGWCTLGRYKSVTSHDRFPDHVC